MHLTIDELLSYTDEERAKWQRWFAANGNEHLKIALTGETCPTVGALVLHCFWAEMFYAYFMRDEILTEESDLATRNKDLPADDAEKLFAFGQSARDEMRAFTRAAGADEWERGHVFEAKGFRISGPARKLVAHILVHEIRHWAQIAFAVRQHGLAPPGDHDLLFSESFGSLGTRT